jgi:basic membrane protein A
VFNVAGQCGLGTLEAAKAAGVWGIGVDSDQAFLGPHVLTSVLKRFEAGFVTILRQVEDRRFSPGRDTILTMSDEAVGLGRISPKVPRSLLEQLDALRRRIVAGEIRVPGAFPRPGA